MSVFRIVAYKEGLYKGSELVGVKSEIFMNSECVGALSFLECPSYNMAVIVNTDSNFPDRYFL